MTDITAVTAGADAEATGQGAAAASLSPDEIMARVDAMVAEIFGGLAFQIFIESRQITDEAAQL